jgi:site-specific DNA-methyltransferase (cytosine-N4-specific)
MIWLGMDQPAFKKREIGSHRKFSSKGKNGATIETFKAEMKSIFMWMKAVLRPEGHACFVVGNSVIRRKTYDNAELLAGAAARAGYVEIARLSRNRNKRESNADADGAQKIVVFRNG